MLIGLLGFQQHRWQSVERTRRFYERTLAAEFDLRIADTNGQFSGLKLDAIVNFSGHMGWSLSPTRRAHWSSRSMEAQCLITAS